MSHPVSAPLPAALPARIPVREILPLAALVTLLALITLYFVSAEDGVTALFSGGYVHEFLHDGRHLLAFPCH
ncbi:MAG: CbtB domain-containing protein [Thermocrispum sp.]